MQFFFCPSPTQTWCKVCMHVWASYYGSQIFLFAYALGKQLLWNKWAAILDPKDFVDSHEAIKQSIIQHSTPCSCQWDRWVCWKSPGAKWLTDRTHLKTSLTLLKVSKDGPVALFMTANKAAWMLSFIWLFPSPSQFHRIYSLLEFFTRWLPRLNWEVAPPSASNGDICLQEAHTVTFSPWPPLNSASSHRPLVHHDYCMCWESTTNIWTDSAYLVAVTRRLLFQQTPDADAEPGAFLKAQIFPDTTHLLLPTSAELMPTLCCVCFGWRCSRILAERGSVVVFFFFAISSSFPSSFSWVSLCFCPLTSSLSVHMHRINSLESGRAGEKGNKCVFVCTRLCVVCMFPRPCSLEDVNYRRFFSIYIWWPLPLKKPGVCVSLIVCVSTCECIHAALNSTKGRRCWVCRCCCCVTACFVSRGLRVLAPPSL